MNRVPIIFLDIDGVLNGHHFMREAQSCNICRPCILQLNRIIKRTAAKIVLSSAWRYMVTGKAMTLAGFSYMLRTHGAIGCLSDNWLIGTTEPDEVCPHCGYRHKRRRGKWECDFKDGYRVCVKCGEQSTRGAQVSAWIKAHRPIGRYVVIDDDAFDFAARKHPFVQTDAKRGLTRGKSSEAIKILTETP